MANRAGLRPALTMVALAGLMFLGTGGWAAEDKPHIDARADQWLKRMSDFLGQSPFFTTSVEVWQDLDLSDGTRAQAARTIELQLRRPNKVHGEVRSTRRNRALFYDGKSLTLLNRVDKFYGSIPAPGSIDEALDVASEKFGITMPLEDFLVSNPHNDLLEHVTSGVDIGPTTVLGVPCEHLAFSQDQIDWQVWIQTGPRPVPRKFVITYKDEEGSPQYTAIFTNWDFETKLPDFVFKFEAPPDASKIDVKEIKAAHAQENQKPKTEEK